MAGLECVEHLVTPDYPMPALQQHVDGSVWFQAHLTPQASIDKLDHEVVSAWGAGPNLLMPPAEQAIRATKFKSDCGGKTVEVVYRFELHGQPTPNPKVTSRTEAPDVMYIESEPEGTITAKK